MTGPETCGNSRMRSSALLCGLDRHGVGRGSARIGARGYAFGRRSSEPVSCRGQRDKKAGHLHSLTELLEIATNEMGLMNTGQLRCSSFRLDWDCTLTQGWAADGRT